MKLQRVGSSISRTLAKSSLPRLLNYFNPSYTFNDGESYKDLSLSQEEINKIEKMKYYISKFLTVGQINLIYASSNVGKTTATFSLMNHIISKNSNINVCYIDGDNGLSGLRSRLKTINPKQFHYINTHRLKKDPIDVFTGTVNSIRKTKNLSSSIIIIDSLQHFVPNGDVSGKNAEPNLKKLLAYMHELREEGLTMIILHHTTKEKDGMGNETTFRGHNMIKDNIDNMYLLSRNDNEKEYVFETIKNRGDETTKFNSFEYNDELIIEQIYSYDNVKSKPNKLSVKEKLVLNRLNETIKAPVLKTNLITDLVSHFKSTMNGFGTNNMKEIIDNLIKAGKLFETPSNLGAGKLISLPTKQVTQ